MSGYPIQDIVFYAAVALCWCLGFKAGFRP